MESSILQTMLAAKDYPLWEPYHPNEFAASDRQLSNDLPVGDARIWFAQMGLPAHVDYKDMTLIPVAVDNGNVAGKISVTASDGRVVTLRVPTAFKQAERIRSGEREVTYIMDGQRFWIGNTALRHEGEELPIGSTAARFADNRMVMFLAAAIVEALHLAGHQPGKHNLMLGVSVPDEEIEEGDDSSKLDKLPIRADTRKAITTHIRNKTLSVTRVDKHGIEAMWSICFAAVSMQPQTAGTVFAYTKTPRGRTVIDRDRLLVINIGGGDTFQSEVSTNPFQMTSNRIGNGTVDIARALWRRLGETEQNDAAAQYALQTRRVLIDGRMTVIDETVDEVLTSVGQTLTSRTVARSASSRLFILITGGGVWQVERFVDERMDALEPPRIKGKSYDLVDKRIAGELNSIGSLLGMLAAVLGSRR